MVDVCKFSFSNTKSKTNYYGHAKFPDFMLLRGPQGLYDFQFKSPELSLFKSLDVQYTNYNSQVAQILILNSINLTTIKFELGVPLPAQPKIRLLDYQGTCSFLTEGNPIKGKQVVAFTYPTGIFSAKSPPYFVNPNSIGILENAISEESDENGFISYTNLTVVGKSLGFNCRLARSVRLHIFHVRRVSSKTLLPGRLKILSEI